MLLPSKMSQGNPPHSMLQFLQLSVLLTSTTLQGTGGSTFCHGICIYRACSVLHKTWTKASLGPTVARLVPWLLYRMYLVHLMAPEIVRLPSVLTMQKCPHCLSVIFKASRRWTRLRWRKRPEYERGKEHGWSETGETVLIVGKVRERCGLGLRKYSGGQQWVSLEIAVRSIEG